VVRAGVYVRISRDREGTEVGVRRQEQDCRKLAAARRWEVVEVYSDDDVSASRGVRKSYRRMLCDLEDGRLDAIVAYSSSRFYRKVRELDELIGLVERRHVEVATVVSGRLDLTTADGRMTARLLAVIDQGEAERIGERSGRARADIKAAGGWLGGGAVPFGYERVYEFVGKRRKVKEHRVRRDQKKIVREVIRRVLAGESLNGITRDLNARGVTTAQGRLWQPSRLSAMVTSPFIAGRYPDGTRGNWPAIVTDDEHLLLTARLRNGNGAKGQKPARAYALSGMLVCSECGRRLLGSGRRYVCSIRNGGCGRVRAASHHVDAYVRERLFEHLDGLPEPEPTPEPDDGPALAELRRVEARLHELREDLADGKLTTDDFTVARDKLLRDQANAERSVLEGSQRSRIDFRRLVDPTPPELNEDYAAFIGRIVMTPAKRQGRGAERDIPQRVTIEWK
jgi:DNA invertase Pin-like site-specific DNA recombinase